MKTVAAENLLLKQQLLVIRRSRGKAPMLTSLRYINTFNPYIPYNEQKPDALLGL